MVTESSTRNRSSSGQKRRAGPKPPISAHPAFAAIVALWFAALLGIGSLIVPVALFENLVTITGLSAILPSAQPPLGVTARLIIALGAAGIGIVSGLLLARKVAAAQAAPAPQRFHDEKVPISALEELGGPSLDQPVDAPPFSRSLNSSAPSASDGSRGRESLVASDSSSDEFLDYAPMPGVPDRSSEPTLNVPQDSDGSAPVEQNDADALELIDTDIDVAADRESLDVSDLGDALSNSPEPAATDFAAEVEAPPALVADRAEPAPEAIVAESKPLTAEELISRPLGELGIVHLVERFALSLQRTPPTKVSAPATMDADTVLDIADEAPFAPSIPTMPDALRPIEYGVSAGSYQDDEETEEYDDLAMMDLTAALAGQTRPFASPAQDLPSAETGTDESDDTEADDDRNCSSLLDMKKTFSAEAESVRIDDTREQGLDTEPNDSDVEPVVVFPGREQGRAMSAADQPSSVHNSADPKAGTPSRRFDPPKAVSAEDPQESPETTPARTELALREALEKLQKMSGVG